MLNDGKQAKSVSGLSFKNILESLGSDREELYQDTDVFTNDDKSVFYRFSFKLRKYIKNTGLKIRYKTSIFAFIFDIGIYFAIRMRVLSILVAVFFEVFLGWGEFFKRFVVKNMFWGRGGLFKYLVQVVSVIVGGFLFVASLLNAPGSSEGSLLSKSVVPVMAVDLITQRSSGTTQKPENRGRTEPDEYIVKSGDTLASIAKFYGVSSETIMWSNNLSEGDFIHPGDRLSIPRGDGVLVLVKKGDTVESLAKKYNSNPQLIVEQNYLVEPYEIRAGDNIFVPDGRPPEPPRPTVPVYSGIVASGSSNYLKSSQVVSGVGRFLNWPVQGGRGSVTQCFSGWHNGVDIADSSKPNLVAASNGTVSFAGCQSACPRIGTAGGYGLAWTVVIDHGNGLSSVYGHLNAIYVKTGQTVSSGQVIGQMGNSGTVYRGLGGNGVHVHFMILRGGSWSGTNPAPYLKTSICGY